MHKLAHFAVFPPSSNTDALTPDNHKSPFNGRQLPATFDSYATVGMLKLYFSGKESMSDVIQILRKEMAIPEIENVELMIHGYRLTSSYTQYHLHECRGENALHVATMADLLSSPKIRGSHIDVLYGETLALEFQAAAKTLPGAGKPMKVTFQFAGPKVLPFEFNGTETSDKLIKFLRRVGRKTDDVEVNLSLHNRRVYLDRANYEEAMHSANSAQQDQLILVEKLRDFERHVTNHNFDRVCVLFGSSSNRQH